MQSQAPGPSPFEVLIIVSAPLNVVPWCLQKRRCRKGNIKFLSPIGRYRVENLRGRDGGFVVADDLVAADGVRVFDYGQALDAAQKRAKTPGLLTARECEVLQQIVVIGDNAGVAKALGISIDAVEVHLRDGGRGVNFGRKSKLTKQQRKQALARKQAEEPLTEIAKTYNVSHMTISV